VVQKKLDMKQIFAYFIVFVTMLAACQKPAVQQKIDLAGEWKFAIDSLDQGVSGAWFSQALNDLVTLPGSMTTNGKGNDITLKTPWIGQIVDSSFYKKSGIREISSTRKH
jgi:hypothetical protein